MIDTIIFDVGRVLVNWDYESYLKRFAFGPEKTKAIAARNLRRPLLAPVRPRNSHTGGDCKRILLPRPGIHRRNQRGFRPLRGNHHPAAVCRKLGTLLKRKRLPPLHPLQLLRRPLRAHQRENALPPLHGRNPLLLHLPFNKTGTGDLPAPDPEILPHPGPLRIPRRHQSKRRGRRAGRDSWNSFYGI